MKILLINNSAFSNHSNSFFCEPKTGNFACELKLLGHDIVMYGQAIEASENIHSFAPQAHGIRTYVYLRKNNKILNYLSLYIKAIPQVLKADFVYIYYPNSFKYISLFCWFFKKPYGIYVRGEKGLTSTLSKLIYKKANVCFTVTDSFTQTIKKLSDNDRVYTIRPMIDLTIKDIFLDRNYQKTPSSFKLLYLGRVEKDKGIKELIQAVKIIKDRGYTFSLTIVGDGSFMSELKQIIESLHLTAHVILEGAVMDSERIRQYYINSDLYILPTYHEGFPRTLYESMTYGTPIITTFVGGISSVMKNDFNCVEIKPRSVDSIVNNLTDAFESYSKYVKYATRAFNTVKPFLDPRKPSHAAHLNQLLQELKDEI